MTEKPATRGSVDADAAFSPMGDPESHPTHPDAPQARTGPREIDSCGHLRPALIGEREIRCTLQVDGHVVHRNGGDAWGPIGDAEETDRA